MKDKNIASILAFPLFGGWGAHKFYLGQVGAGIVYLAFAWTLIPAIIAFFEFIILALMDRDEFNRRYNGSHVLGSSPVVVNMLPPGPAAYPPGYPPQGYSAYPPGAYPPGVSPYPPGVSPYPPGVSPYPPGVSPYPPGAYPPGAYPPGVSPYPPGAYPPGVSAPPPVTYPPPGGAPPDVSSQTGTSGQASPRRGSVDDVIATLEKLNELRIAGLLTDEEFAQQKARILQQM